MATITIDPTAAIGTINPLLFGHFVEHLGRCVYGGIYEPTSPLSDESGFRLDVLEAVRGLAPTHLRYPGGNFVSGYHWRDGVGPKESRPVRFDHAWSVVEPNQMGSHEGVDYCRRVGATPHFCVNLGSGSPEEAADWVEYCNGGHDTTLTRQRAANGAPEPFAIPLWDLGNEINGPWQIGYKTASDYAVVAREAALRMREVDPTIKLVACGWENSQVWNTTVLETLAPYMDYLSLHLYVDDDDYSTAMAMPLLLEQLSRWHSGLARLVCREKKLTKTIPLAWDEWGVWGNTPGVDPDQLRYTVKHALMTAGYLNALLRCADIVAIANYAQIVNVLAPIFTSPEGMFRQTVYWPLALYRRLAGHQSLHALVRCDGYRAQYTFRTWQVDEQVPYLDVSAALAPDQRTLTICVVNRHPDVAVPTELRIIGAQVKETCTAEELTGPSIEATNSFEQPDLVTVQQRAWTADATHPVYTFPAHSMTLLTLPLG